MRILKISLFNAFILAFSFTARANDQNDNLAQVSPQIKSVCQQYLQTQVSTADIPADLELESLKNCNATYLYYGIHQPADYTRARQCAFVKKDYGVLTMIYANGKGVSRNWELAIKFACQAGFAPDEIEGRVQHLLDMRAKADEKQQFDFCDDITSGYMMGVCAETKSLIDQAQRNKKLSSLVTNWTDNEKQALEKLQQSAQNFFSVHSDNEVDLSGTARAALSIEEQESLQNDFLSSLEEFSNGHFPHYSEAQAAQYDQELNKIYQQIEKNTEFSMGSITRQGIKKTQLAWLKYRDTWVNFGKIKYPQINPQDWQTWLTQQRITMLQELNSN